MVELYNEGIYNEFSYGSASTELLAAQDATVRQTGLRVSVTDEQLNAWEVWATDTQTVGGLGPILYKPVNGSYRGPDKEFYSYRGGQHTAIMPNGTIVRVRNGDPSSASDRQLWICTVTDPTVVAQWNSWSVYNAGPVYGTPKVVSDGSAGGYYIYWCDGTNIKANGTTIESAFTLLGRLYTPIGWVPVIGRPEAGYIIYLREHKTDTKRVYDAYWMDDWTSPGASAGLPFRANFSWNRSPINSAIEAVDGRIALMSCNQLHADSRNTGQGFTQWVTFQTSLSDMELTAPRAIRGIGGGPGFNYIDVSTLVQLSDGYYYYFGVETHSTAKYEPATELGGLIVWARSKDLINWTAATVGPIHEYSGQGWGFGGAVEKDGYLYVCSTEAVWRRPTTPVVNDLTNYVPEVNFSIPRDNQVGTGTMVIANPAGINDDVLTFQDRQITIEPGIKLDTGQYEFVEYDKWFISQCNREIKGAVNRINLSFDNLWGRLDTQMRDVVNFVGQLDWYDWAPDRRNKAFNYYFASAQSFTETTTNKLTTSGIVLYTGWKGHHFDFTCAWTSRTSSSSRCRIIMRYVDARNYLYLEYDPADGYVELYEKSNNVDNFLYTWGNTVVDASPKIRFQLHFGYFRLWINNVEYGDMMTDGQWLDGDWRNSKPGYVGFSTTAGSYNISYVHLIDFEAPLTSADLIKFALAMGDFHDVNVGSADSRQLAVIWGPQTDAQTIAEALLQSMQIDKLQLAWRNGQVAVGKFNDETSVRTLQNEIIDSEEVQEPNRRINMAVIDGNEESWIEIDEVDTLRRGRNVIGYFDLPELLDHEAVVNRAQEEIKRAGQGSSPSGTTPLFFDLERMDAITWIDETYEARVLRIEGIEVDINQSMTPFQRQTFDLSEFVAETTNLIQEEGEGELVDETPGDEEP